MKIRPIQYIPAQNLGSAKKLLKENLGRAKVLAGGTDLLGGMKDAIHAQQPELLIGLKTVKGQGDIKEEGDGIRIGALTTLAEIAKSPLIKAKYPLLEQAAVSVASPQIRNVATLAGNLCQEPRCWYYRNPENHFNCLRKGGRWCDALFAENRYHSIYGGMCVDAAPCKRGCPIHNNIPDYMEKLRAHDVPAATEILLRTNPLAAITGRICSHNCQTECNRHDFDESVAIRDVERFLGDYSLEHVSTYYPAPAKESGKSVAIVGSGPAGLTAAFFMRKQGHSVTIYEQMAEAGGMLTYSIPGYRLPKEVVQKQAAALEQMGIRFVYNAKIGSGDLTLESLKASHNVVFLATGLWNSRKLKIEKSELLDSGLEFLLNVQLKKPTPVGKRVLVIGGGSVAVDVAITAKRLGASHVIMACLESLDIMPALPEDLEMAEADEIEILPSWGPDRVLEENGKLTGLELVRCTSVFNKEHRFAPTFDPNEKKVVKADQVLVAIGQAADLSYAEPHLQMERGLLLVDKVSRATNMAGVFAGGDATGRAVNIVQAMAEGAETSVFMDRYLVSIPQLAAEEKGKKFLKINPAALGTSQAAKTPQTVKAEHTLQSGDFLTFAPETVTQEALRCANCGCVAVSCSDLAPALIALDATIQTSDRTLPAAELFAARESSTTVLAEDELIESIHLPAQAGSKQTYLKFRIRNSIDFPIVSLAMQASLEGKRLHNVRVVLGAVAPVPMRMKEVEGLLEGKPLSEALSSDAAALAVKNAQPLARNKAKVQVVKALIAKALRSFEMAD